MLISKGRLLLQPLWRVFAATFLPLLADAFLKGINATAGDPALQTIWWVPIAAPLIAVGIRALVAQPVDSIGVGVKPDPNPPPAETPTELF